MGRQLMDLAEEYFQKNNPGGKKWSYQYIFYAPFIAPEKLRSAMQAYADFDPQQEKPILLMDDTLFGSAQKGLIITDRALYYNLSVSFSGSDGIDRVELKNIESFTVEIKTLGANLLVNGVQFGYTTSLNSMNRKEGIILQELMRLFIKSIQSMNNRSDSSTLNSSIPTANAAKPEKDDPISLLKRLKELVDIGVLSQEEFENKKKSILDGI